MRRATALVLLSRLAAAEVDGGSPDAGRWDDALYSVCPASADAPVALDGGVLLSDARAARVACLLTTCDESRRELQASPPMFSAQSFVLAAVVLVVGLAAGSWFGWSLARLVFK